MSEGGAVVLIVEDDEAARVAIAGNLRARGHEVDEAGDVREALRLWDCRRPDLILLDLGLPDLDGQAVILRVRREATTPIIVVSARRRDGGPDTARGLGHGLLGRGPLPPRLRLAPAPQTRRSRSVGRRGQADSGRTGGGLPHSRRVRGSGRRPLATPTRSPATPTRSPTALWHQVPAHIQQDVRGRSRGGSGVGDRERSSRPESYSHRVCPVVTKREVEG